MMQMYQRRNLKAQRDIRRRNLKPETGNRKPET
jgi:hypothetical protein